MERTGLWAHPTSPVHFLALTKRFHLVCRFLCSVSSFVISSDWENLLIIPGLRERERFSVWLIRDKPVRKLMFLPESTWGYYLSSVGRFVCLAGGQWIQVQEDRKDEFLMDGEKTQLISRSDQGSRRILIMIFMPATVIIIRICRSHTRTLKCGWIPESKVWTFLNTPASSPGRQNESLTWFFKTWEAARWITWGSWNNVLSAERPWSRCSPASEPDRSCFTSLLQQAHYSPCGLEVALIITESLHFSSFCHHMDIKPPI